MEEYLSFEEVAAVLKCSLRKVHQIVLEDKRLLAQRITTNGMILESCGPDGVFAYDLNFCCHVSDEGKITSDVYESQPDGKTVVTQVLDAGYLRIERSELARFILSGVVPGSNSEMQDLPAEARKASGGVEDSHTDPCAVFPAMGGITANDVTIEFRGGKDEPLTKNSELYITAKRNGKTVSKIVSLGELGITLRGTRDGLNGEGKLFRAFPDQALRNSQATSVSRRVTSPGSTFPPP